MATANKSNKKLTETEVVEQEKVLEPLFRSVDGYDPRTKIRKVVSFSNPNEEVKSLHINDRIDWCLRWADSQGYNVRFDEDNFEFHEKLNQVVARCYIYFVKKDDEERKEFLVANGTSSCFYNPAISATQFIIGETMTYAKGRALANLGFSNLGDRGDDERSIAPNVPSVDDSLVEPGAADDANGSQIPNQANFKSKGKANNAAVPSRVKSKLPAVDPSQALPIDSELPDTLDKARNYKIQYGTFAGRLLGDVVKEKPSFIEFAIDKMGSTDPQLKAAAIMIKENMAADENEKN